MGKKKKGLGRGLSALIPPKPAEQAVATVTSLPQNVTGLVQLAVEEMLPSDAQPRQTFPETQLDELARSITQHGILQPIVVRKRGKSFEIVAGERRWRAAQRAGLKEVPALVSDIAETDTLTVALVENVQRQDLNAIEEAEAYKRLHEVMGYSQAEIAEAVGKDRTTITNSMRLLKLPETVRQLVLDGELSMGHARALLGLDKEREIEQLGREVVSKKLSVRDTEKRVRSARTPDKPKAVKEEVAGSQDARMRIQRALGTKVDLKIGGRGKGTVVVHFSSQDELSSLMERIGA